MDTKILLFALIGIAIIQTVSTDDAVSTDASSGNGLILQVIGSLILLPLMFLQMYFAPIYAPFQMAIWTFRIFRFFFNLIFFNLIRNVV